MAGLNGPFLEADTLSAALAGRHVCAETIRKCCHQAATEARERRDELDSLPEAFAKAASQDREAHIDAGEVDTPDGWRDADYEQRDLPSPSARSVIAEVEAASAFGPRGKAEAERLGVVDTPARTTERLSVPGDGAEWIWNPADVQSPGAAQVLDVYHAVDEPAEAGREEFGSGTVEMGQWLAEARENLVADGCVGACEALMRPAAGEAEGVEASVGGDERQLPRGMMGAEVAAAVLNYFCGHQIRPGYAGRLREGRLYRERAGGGDDRAAGERADEEGVGQVAARTRRPLRRTRGDGRHTRVERIPGSHGPVVPTSVVTPPHVPGIDTAARSGL